MKSKRQQNDEFFVEWLAWLMDRSIRIGPWSIGLDGLIGLVPGLGDLTGSAVSFLIVAAAIRSRISKGAIVRMVINVGLDALAGSIPLVGDIFDFAFKANVRNVEIYKEALNGERTAALDWAFVIFVVLLLLAMMALPVLGLVYLARFLQSHVFI